MTDLYKSGPVGHCGNGGSPAIAARKAADGSAEADRAAFLRVTYESGADGITTERAASKLGWQSYRGMPRASDLRKAGMIFDSQRREKNVRGIGCIVWVHRDFAGPVKIGGAA